MRRIALSLAVITFGTAAASQSAIAQAPGNQLSLSIGASTDYKQYGLSVSRSRPSARFSADFEHMSGFFAGGILTGVDFATDSIFGNSRDLLANVYAGYIWRNSRWSANASASRYIYPGSRIPYDYTQVAANISFRDRYFFGLARSENYLDLNREAYQIHAGMSLPWVWETEVGVNAGRFRATELFNTRYSFWDIGVSKVVDRFALDLRFHDNTYDGTSVIGESGDDRWVFSVGYSIRSGSP